MPIVSAVLHVSQERMSDVIRDLSSDACLTVGEPIQGRLPVVASTVDRSADKAVWRSIERHADVRFLELAFADFSDIHTDSEVD